MPEIEIIFPTAVTTPNADAERRSLRAHADPLS